MREIEFRGFIRNNNYEEKVVVNGEAFRGYWCYWNEFGVVIAEETCKDIYLSEHCCYYGMVEKNRVIPETVGQYTGIRDKNGKKVYEGDIVKTKYGRLCRVVRVFLPSYVGWDLEVFDENNALTTKKPDEYDLYYKDNLEVIGNIFDKESDNED